MRVVLNAEHHVWHMFVALGRFASACCSITSHARTCLVCFLNGDAVSCVTLLLLHFLMLLV